ncbi:MAG: DUF3794 domain-containing protein [Clostridia bacterium]|nr:DUF3794 domain-containing protein [Clostridia bacterium]
MELNVKRQTIEAERLVGCEKQQLLLRAETLVSGAGREDVEILMADAAVHIENTDLQTDRLSVNGSVKCQAAYRLSSEASARAVHAETGLMSAFDIKGASPGMTAQVKAQVDEVRAKYENGHMVFDVSVTLFARVMELKPVSLITGIEGIDDVETKYAEVESVKLAAENSVLALVSNSVSLPSQLDARTALMEWATVSNVDARKDLGGVRVTGTVLLETLISSGAPSRPIALIRNSMPLDQLVEMPEWLTDSVQASCQVKSVSTEVEQALLGEDSTLKMEAEIDISVSAVGHDKALALTDAYAVGREAVRPEMQENEICLSFKDMYLFQPFRGSMMLPEGAGAVGSVCALRARANVSDIASQNGNTNIAGVVDAQVIYMSGSGDKLVHANAYLPFEVSVAASLPEDAWVSVSVQSAEGNALMSDRIEMKCMLGIGISAREKKSIQTVSDVIPDGENARVHGIRLVWPEAGDEVWDVAKRYLVPAASIEKAGQGRIVPGKAIVIRK